MRKRRTVNLEVYHAGTGIACPRWRGVGWASRGAAILGAEACEDRNSPRYCGRRKHKIRSIPQPPRMSWIPNPSTSKKFKHLFRLMSMIKKVGRAIGPEIDQAVGGVI